MGWLQVKRWLSFLPAAFVVYILLHYLVYQPDLTGPQPPVLVPGGRSSNGTQVSDVLGPGASAGRILPPLDQDGDGPTSTNDILTQPPAAAAAALAQERVVSAQAEEEASSNTTTHQGSAITVDSTDSRSLVRFDSARKALGGVSFREPLSALSPPHDDDVSFLSSEGGLIGAGGTEKGLTRAFAQSGPRDPSHSLVESSYSEGVLRGPPEGYHMTSSGALRAIDNTMPSSPEDVSLMSPLASLPSSPTSSSLFPSSPSSSHSGGSEGLLKMSRRGSSPLLAGGHPSTIHNLTSVADSPKSLLSSDPHVLPNRPSSSPNNPPPPPPYPPPNDNPSLTEYDTLDTRQGAKDAALLFDQDSMMRSQYQMYPEGYDANDYSAYQHYKLPEEMMMDEAVHLRRALYHHPPPPPPPPYLHHPMAPRVRELPSRYDPYTFSRRGPEVRAASQEREGRPLQGRAGASSHTAVRVSSTVQTVSSSSSSSGSAADATAKGADAGVLPPQAAAIVEAAKNKPQPPNVVVVQGTGSAPQPKQTVTKKTMVAKSNVASSSGLSINALSGKTKVGEKYESGFSVSHEELCINNGRDLKVLVLITTAPDHEKHRTAVRQTWGHFAIRKDVVMAFVVGRTTNANIQSNIDKENEIYGDIIQANFIDHYANLTLKTVSMFEWVKTYCSESHFVLKTDDDMFINMPLLLTFIDSKKNDRRVMYGRLAKGWKPVRNKKSKYYIDVATYKKTKYPDFLTGPAYLFTSDIVDDIYQKALGTTFFVLEDVLVTGIVGESLRIRRVGDSRFRNEKIKLTDTCTLMKTVSIHMVKYEEQFDIYKRTLDGKAKCKTG
ncbi:uncharacterized protein LOC135195821 isoform X2 [Macrobrachium nipponense]